MARRDKPQPSLNAPLDPPLSDDQLAELFRDLEAAVVAVGCDGSRRLTEAWLAQHDRPAAPVLRWLAEHGGFCDCEVLLNVQVDWESNRRQSPQLALV